MPAPIHHLISKYSGMFSCQINTYFVDDTMNIYMVEEKFSGKIEKIKMRHSRDSNHGSPAFRASVLTVRLPLAAENSSNALLEKGESRKQPIRC